MKKFRNFTAARSRGRLGDLRLEALIRPPKRVFINNADSYSSGYIARFLCDPTGKLLVDAEIDIEKDKVDLKLPGALQIVGTVSEKSDENRLFMLEEYFGLNRDELLPKLLESDVIIYNISQHEDQVEEAMWALTALHKDIAQFSGPKTFILISTVLTWVCIKPGPNELVFPFTDHDFLKRRPHPNFKPHYDLERMVVKVGKNDRSLFSTYVVVSGLQYGMGEQVFHYFFKTSWLGRENEIPVFGEGNNSIPTIHIVDLASVIHEVIKHQPEPYYLLAVDSAKNTMKEIVKAVATTLGPGKIQNKPFQEVYLTQDLSMLEIDSLRVNLRLDGVLVRELFEVNWRYESGLVTNIEQMVEEYRQIRGLEPVRVCVLGPPAVGKTTVSKLIAEHYKIHHLTVKDTIAETISRLEEAVKEPESEESATEAQELLNNLKDSMEQSGGSLDEQLLVKLMKEKLMSNPCRNQGYVLDGVPETYDQAKELFSDSETEVSGNNVPSAKITPEFVLCLDAPDEILQDRVMNMPEGLGEHSTVYELFLQRLSKYRDDNKGDEAEDFFDELDIPSTCREITNDDEPDSMMLMQMVTDAVGKPRNYGPTNLEMEEEERRKTEEKMRRENQQRVQEEQKEIEEARQRAVRWEEWRKGLEQVRQQEQDLLEAQSAPMKNYLMEHVMPTLTKGLIECCMEQPLDPVDFLAEYLFKNNPYDAEVTSLTLTDLDQKEEDEEKDKEEVEVEGEEEEEEEADCSDED